MARGLFAPGGNLDEDIAEPANGRDGPQVSFCAENRFHLANKNLGCQSVAIRRSAKNSANQLRSRFDTCVGGRNGRRTCRHRLWFRPIELLRLCLLAAQFELQSPAMRRAPRFTPELERTDLGETGSETYSQIDVTHFLAVAQQGH